MFISLLILINNDLIKENIRKSDVIIMIIAVSFLVLSQPPIYMPDISQTTMLVEVVVDFVQ